MCCHTIVDNDEDDDDVLFVCLKNLLRSCNFFTRCHVIQGFGTCARTYFGGKRHDPIFFCDNLVDSVIRQTWKDV